MVEALAVQFGVEFDPHASRRTPSRAARRLLEQLPLGAWERRALVMGYDDAQLEVVGGVGLLETGASFETLAAGRRINYTLTLERELLSLLERVAG